MKKTLCILLLSVLLLTGCSNSASTENEFYVNFTNNTADELYFIHMEYAIDGIPCGGGGTGNADGSMVSIGEKFSCGFIPRDFPENADLSKFQIQLFLLDANETEYPVENIIEIHASYGNTYEISLTGNTTEGYTAHLIPDQRSEKSK